MTYRCSGSLWSLLRALFTARASNRGRRNDGRSTEWRTVRRARCSRSWRGSNGSVGSPATGRRLTRLRRAAHVAATTFSPPRASGPQPRAGQGSAVARSAPTPATTGAGFRMTWPVGILLVPARARNLHLGHDGSLHARDSRGGDRHGPSQRGTSGPTQVTRRVLRWILGRRRCGAVRPESPSEATVVTLRHGGGYEAHTRGHRDRSTGGGGIRLRRRRAQRTSVQPAHDPCREGLARTDRPGNAVPCRNQDDAGNRRDDH